MDSEFLVELSNESAVGVSVAFYMTTGSQTFRNQRRPADRRQRSTLSAWTRRPATR
jgi:hypothetical protein